MKHHLEHLLQQAFTTLQQSGQLPEDLTPSINVESTKDNAHGDYASNLALILAKPCRQSPRKLAEQLIAVLPADPILAKIEIAGAGFINFFISKSARAAVVAQVLEQGEQFGTSTVGQHQKVLIEFVSANPTGPLHVGHGRSAAFGATLSNILKAAGYDVSLEYYVNDAGRQMNILAVSVWLRYLQLAGQPIVFPANAYKGDYVTDIAQKLWTEQQARYVHPWEEISNALPADDHKEATKNCILMR